MRNILKKVCSVTLATVVSISGMIVSMPIKSMRQRRRSYRV